MIEGVALPATAQGMLCPSICPGRFFNWPLSTVANQKAMYLHKKLNTIVKDKEHTKPFEFHNKGTLAYLGDWFVFSRSF